MKVVYIADDGKEFDDEFDCINYEWKVNHPHLKDIGFYDEENNKLTDIFSEEVYCITETVVIPDEIALKELQEFADYTGFCCYKDINKCGEWIFNYDIETFVKKSKLSDFRR